MAYTTPNTVTGSDVLTAALWNAQIRDNFAFLQKPPRAIVSIPINQSIPTEVRTYVPFTASTSLTAFDCTVTPGALSSNIALSGKVTINTAGIYQVSFCIGWEPDVTGAHYVSVWKTVGGVSTRMLSTGKAVQAGVATNAHHTAAGLINLAAGDTLSLSAEHGTAGVSRLLADAEPYSNLLSVGWFGAA